MKWAYHIKYKLKSACVLTGIIVVILLSNLADRSSFSSLDRSMSSVVNDRLKPATYIYEISNNLYQKRLLQGDGSLLSQGELQKEVASHNRAIAGLVRHYDGTVLTPEEQRQWTRFKAQLNEYNQMEQTWLASGSTSVLPELMVSGFDRMMQHLDQLSKIQVGEGNMLEQSSHSIVNGTVMLSYLEISLLIVLGLFALVLLSTSDHALFRRQQNQVLN